MGCFKSKKPRGQVGRREQEKKVIEGRAENSDGGSQMEEEDGVGSEARRRGGRGVDGDIGSTEVGGGRSMIAARAAQTARVTRRTAYRQPRRPWELLGAPAAGQLLLPTKVATTRTRARQGSGSSAIDRHFVARAQWLGMPLHHADETLATMYSLRNVAHRMVIF